MNFFSTVLRLPQHTLLTVSWSEYIDAVNPNLLGEFRITSLLWEDVTQEQPDGRDA